jgi:hypothetical protein
MIHFRSEADMSDTGGAIMARPKKGAREIKRIVIQGSVQWCDYVEKGARHCRTDVSKLFDVAVRDYLRSQGFDKNPPERVP